MSETIATITGPEQALRAGMNALDYLRSRGFVHDVTDEQGLREAFANGPVTFYIGFDPTATSLHIGNLVGIMLMANLQRLGHQPIALGGGGTVMVGDPSGKTEMRQLLTVETIESNLRMILPQFARYLDFEGGRFGDNRAALLVNNADWLLKLELIPFLRDVGRHFSVNEMLAAETYKVRLETTGLSFIEFNYRVLQAYDFLHLYQQRGCIMQAGGSDQWGNITAGTDLIRRVEGGKAFGLVTPLIATSDGRKMGKSETGAVWLDRERTSPLDFYQWWVNTTDDDVARFLRLYTFLPEERIADLTSVDGAALREAKAVLAWEVTALTHGSDAADEAAATSRSLFSRDRGAVPDAAILASDATIDLTLDGPVTIAELFVQAGLAGSRNEARRLAQQGGLSLDDTRVSDADAAFEPTSDVVLLRAGKKRMKYVRLDGGYPPGQAFDLPGCLMSGGSGWRTLLGRLGAWLRMEHMAGDGRMRSFYWLVEDELAGCGRPGGHRDDTELLERDLEWLREQGIGALLSLTETPLPDGALERYGIASLHLPVEDLSPPDPDQLQDALAFIDYHLSQNRPVAVHCLVGQGRTGTVLAARLIRDGASLADALAELRTLSPGAISSPSQERALAEWERQRGWIL